MNPNPGRIWSFLVFKTRKGGTKTMKFIANRSELLPIAKRCCLVIGRQFTTKETVCVLMEADEKQNLVQFTARGNECVLQALAHRQRVSVHAGAVRGRSDYGRNRQVNDFHPQRESRLPLYVDGHREVSCSRTMHAGFAHGSRELLRNWRESAVFCGEKQRFQFACAELRSCHGA